MFAETCVFDKQSLPPFHCGPSQLHRQAMSPKRACLLPKLRHQFAEFLNWSSPKRLRILSSSTCVGLRYGLIIISMRSFSRKPRITYFSLKGSSSRLRVNNETDLPISSPYSLKPPSNRRPCYLSPSLLHVKQSLRGTGILTCYPSTTPFGLALGPD